MSRREARGRPSSFGVIVAGLGCLGLAGLAVWWLADHRWGIAWAVSVVRARFPDVPQISAPALNAWLSDGQLTPPQLVDARSEAEYEVSHLPGAVRIDPASSVALALTALDPRQPAVVYCSAGYRGARLARRLKQSGCRDVWNLEGGIFAWANADLPLEREGRPVRRVHPFSRFFSRLLKPGRTI